MATPEETRDALLEAIKTSAEEVPKRAQTLNVPTYLVQLTQAYRNVMGDD